MDTNTYEFVMDKKFTLHITKTPMVVNEVVKEEQPA